MKMFKEYINSWFLILFIVIVIYWYFTRNFNYWSKRGINGPKPKLGVGNLIDQFITNKSDLELDWLNKYGKIYGIFIGNTPVLRVAEPKLIKHILVKDFPVLADKYSKFAEASFAHHPVLSKQLLSYKINGWKRIRSIVSPTFSTGKMKKMFPIVQDCLQELFDILDSYAKPGREANIKLLFGNFTMDVIGRCAFATKSNAQNEPDNSFVRNAYKVFNPKMSRLIPWLLLPKLVLKICKFYSALEPSVTEFFINMTRRIIKERQNSDQKQIDFIHLLLKAQKKAYEGNQEYEQDGNKIQDDINGKYITEEEVVATALLMFIAGYEPTSTTLTFASYELALNPDIQDRLYREIVTAVDGNADIDYDTLLGLPYLNAVICETMRHHTPDYYLARTASEDYKLGSTGITLYKGQSVEIPIYAMHHCEEFHPDPFRFNPERFMPENSEKLIPYSYLPFSTGPRNCVGMSLGIMEVKLALFEVIRRFRMILVDKTEVALPLTKSHFLSPKHAMVGIEKRVQSFK